MPNRSSHSPQRFLIPLAALIAVAFALAILASPPAAAARAAAAPMAQILPIADACAAPVLEPTSTLINARTGPGPNYPILTELYEGQSYPIAGRHSGFRWWAVNLPDGQTGWVWDSIVLVSGNIDAVPLLQAPQLNGIIPNTQDTWAPTSASPPCVPTATPDVSSQADNENGATPRLVLAAQDDGPSLQSEWSEPVNLSGSGGAANPAMSVDEDGQFQIYWQDIVAGSFVVTGDHEAWSTPISVTAPFSQTIPVLLTDNETQTSVSIWVEGDEANLLMSRIVQSEDIQEQEPEWTEPEILDDSILSFDAVMDDASVLHVVYGRTTLTPERKAGLYYMRSPDQGETWSEPELLFESPYFRTMRPIDAHVTLEAASEGGTVHLYVGWDMRSRKRLFFLSSNDAGDTWTTFTEVATPESTSSIITPFDLTIAAQGNNVLLVWLLGHSEGACRQVYRTSTDHGATWTQREQIEELLPGTASCPEEIELLVGSELIYLLSSYQDQAYMLAWNGESWSEPQLQRTLVYFTNPDTLNTVNLGCKQLAITEEDRLYVVGCDLSAQDTSLGDIWFSSRHLGTAADWFPGADEWSQPAIISAGDFPFRNLRLVTDSASLTHAFWVERHPETLNSDIIRHSQWNGDSWTEPAQIVSTTEPVTNLEAKIDPSAERIFLYWSTQSGQITLSQAIASQAQVASNWDSPRRMPLSTKTGSFPSIAIGNGGAIIAAYSEAINDQRGIYLTDTTDGGQTWSASVQLFDAQVAGWQIVGAPEITITSDDRIHLIFDEREWTVDFDSVSRALYYMNCEGLTSNCTQPELFSESDVAWKTILSTGESTVHRLWQSRESDSLSLRHQMSNNEGNEWQRESVLSSTTIEGTGGEVAVTPSTDGRLFAFAASNNTLQSWIWENAVWGLDQTFSQSLSSGETHALAATVASNGHLVVLFSDREDELPRAGEDPEAPGYQLLNLSKQVADIASPLETPEVTSPPTDVSSPATQSAQTATSQVVDSTPLPTQSLAEQGTPTGDTSAPSFTSTSQGAILAISLIPVILIVIIAFVVGLRRSRRRP